MSRALCALRRAFRGRHPHGADRRHCARFAPLRGGFPAGHPRTKSPAPLTGRKPSSPTAIGFGWSVRANTGGASRRSAASAAWRPSESGSRKAIDREARNFPPPKKKAQKTWEKTNSAASVKTSRRVLRTARIEEVFRHDHPLKGHWNSDFFHNDNPIVLELGCGKGEYTVALAERDPARNYIGIDIKGGAVARSQDRHRTRHEQCRIPPHAHRIHQRTLRRGGGLELWITFPDPRSRPGGPRNDSPRRSSSNTTPGCCGPTASSTSKPIRNTSMPTPTRVIRHFGLPWRSPRRTSTVRDTPTGVVGEDRLRGAFFLGMGLPITYIRFRLDGQRDFPWFDWEEDENSKRMPKRTKDRTLSPVFSFSRWRSRLSPNSRSAIIRRASSVLSITPVMRSAPVP